MRFIPVVVAVAAVLGTSILLALMWIGREETYPGGVLVSPDREFLAHYYGVGGGGAAGWTLDLVSISRAGQTHADGVTALEMRRAYEACIGWTGLRSTLVEIPDAAIVGQETAEVVVDDVAISLELTRVPSTRFGEITGECHGHKMELGRPDAEWRWVE